jgi:hypothetical protein
MERLNLPTYSFNVKIVDQKKFIFDQLRRKFVALTPEEWVRQHFIRYLVEDRNYPVGLISVERGFDLYRTKKRSDILIFSNTGKPWVLVECKAPSVVTNELWFDQAFAYNLSIKASYIMLTNGMSHFCMKVRPDFSGVEFMKEIPLFKNLLVPDELEH